MTYDLWYYLCRWTPRVEDDTDTVALELIVPYTEPELCSSQLACLSLKRSRIASIQQASYSSDCPPQHLQWVGLSMTQQSMPNIDEIRSSNLQTKSCTSKTVSNWWSCRSSSQMWPLSWRLGKLPNMATWQHNMAQHGSISDITVDCSYETIGWGEVVGWCHLNPEAARKKATAWWCQLQDLENILHCTIDISHVLRFLARSALRKVALVWNSQHTFKNKSHHHFVPRNAPRFIWQSQLHLIGRGIYHSWAGSALIETTSPY